MPSLKHKRRKVLPYKNRVLGQLIEVSRTSKILSLFSNIESGKADLSKITRSFKTPGAQKINQSYGTFLDTIRKLIDETRKIGIDIAVDSTQVAASVFSTADKTAEQSELSEIVSIASNEANSAIAEVSENAQYVSEKTTNNLDMARKSYDELVDVTEKIGLINKTVHSFINTVAELGKSSTNITDNINSMISIVELTQSGTAEKKISRRGSVEQIVSIRLQILNIPIY